MLFKLAYRNVTRQKRRSLFTILGMIFGAVIVAFSISLTDGTYDTMISSYTESNSGHVQIHKKGYLDTPSIYKNIKVNEELIGKMEKVDGVEAYSYRVFSGGLIFNKNLSSAVMINGYSKSENEVTKIFSRISNKPYFTSEDEKSLYMSKKLAVLLKLKVGDQAVIISQGADGSIANDQFKVEGVFDSAKLGVSTNSVYMPIKTTQDFLSLGNRVHEIALLSRDFHSSELVAERLNLLLPDELSADSWKVVLKDFYRAMELDKSGNRVSLGIIIFIVAIGVLNTVLMSVLERTREFGVLKAIGTRPFQIGKLIVYENFILASISVVVATFISYGIISYFAVNQIQLPEPISYGGLEVSGMKTLVNLESFLVPALVIYISCFVVCLFPAYRASRISPIKAMNDH